MVGALRRFCVTDDLTPQVRDSHASNPQARSSGSPSQIHLAPSPNLRILETMSLEEVFVKEEIQPCRRQVVALALRTSNKSGGVTEPIR